MKKNAVEIMEQKTTIVEMKNTLKGSNSRFEQWDERISKVDGSANEIIQLEEQKESMIKSE